MMAFAPPSLLDRTSSAAVCTRSRRLPFVINLTGCGLILPATNSSGKILMSRVSFNFASYCVPSYQFLFHLEGLKTKGTLTDSQIKVRVTTTSTPISNGLSS